MSSSKPILTIFGATGNQGGSILDVILADANLKEKYALRGVTRDPTSKKAQALKDQGVEPVKGELDDVESLKSAIAGSYGVFGVTDFWSLMSKERETRQGKNIFDACKANGVKHFVWSDLPYTEKLTNGKLTHIDHFDGKAEVGLYAEENKGDMIVTHVMGAMYIQFAGSNVKAFNGTPTLNMPFPSDNVDWPLLEPRSDYGKYVVGVFEAGSKADSVYVNAVSTWTTPKEVVKALSEVSGKDVVFNKVPAEVFAGFLPEAVRQELLETMLLIGDYNYYGPGTKEKQQESDKWLLPGAKTLSFEEWAKSAGPWTFE
jgi:hypothetical protein